MNNAERSLTKSDVAWLLVKLLGVYLLYVGVAGIITALVVRMNMQEALSSLTEGVRNKAAAPAQGLYWIPWLSLGVGSYLTLKGSFMHNLLMSIPSVSSGLYESEPMEVDNTPKKSRLGLDAVETKKFEAWLESNPAMKERAVFDAVALYRDAQKSEDV